jgi:DNA-binding transcriptional regulator YdaS (Cro superfamily)
MPKKRKSKDVRLDTEENEEEKVLRIHREHMGVYKRVADLMGVDASYVSRIANGTRRNEAVRRALIKHLVGLG